MARLDGVDGPINLGNPGEFTMSALAALVVKLTGGTLRIEHAPLPADDPRQRKPDMTRARALLGFAPKVDLEQGLGLTIADFRGRLAERTG